MTTVQKTYRNTIDIPLETVHHCRADGLLVRLAPGDTGRNVNRLEKLGALLRVWREALCHR